jgi:undecaprenyl-diphosphatase
VSEVSVARIPAARCAWTAVCLWLGFAALTWVVARESVTAGPIDTSIATTVHEWATANHWMVVVALILQFVGSVAASILIVVVVSAVLIFGSTRGWGSMADRRWAAAVLITSALWGALLNTAVKDVVGRSRPPTNGLWWLESSASYPSGHSQAGITVWVAMGVVALLVFPRAWRWRVAAPLMVVGPMIGVSRVVLGVHWPSDVLGGWLLGSAWLLTCLAGFSWLARWRASAAVAGRSHR